MSSEVGKSLESDTKLSTRISHLIGVSAIPAAVLSIAGDFLGPRGGWIVVGLMGFLAIALAAYFLFSLSVLKDGNLPFWYKLTSRDKNLNWIWSARPPIFSHGVHLFLFFGLICIFSAGKTFAALDSGGYIGKNFDAVAAAQQQLGLTRLILEEQKKTSIELGDLNRKADNLKRETSSDPRKELANLQMPWSYVGFLSAVKQQDVVALRLYISANFIFSENAATIVISALESGNEEIQAELADYLRPQLIEVCTPIFYSKSMAERVNPTSSEKELLKKVCGGDEIRKAVRKELDSLEKKFKKDSEALRLWNARSEIEKKRSDERWNSCMATAGIAALTGTIDCGPGTMSPPEPYEGTLITWRNVDKWLE